MATRIPNETRAGTRAAGEVCLPACPACGGLECLCRPRFFAGQLLTEQDLNLLDRYIREKNRLRSRYLHGWGVVCGLEVTCHDCGDQVRVSSGYGLSPCGDDVIVCSDTSVPVCALIRKCTERERRRRECDTPQPRDANCEEGDETWVLAICYDEKPSRGVTALRSAARTCSCGGSSATCGCAGGTHASGCGCGGHGHTNGNGGSNGNGAASGGIRSSTRRPPSQCEPTLICEGYHFEVYRAPSTDDVQGELLANRVGKCIQAYLDFARDVGASSSPGSDPTREQQQRLCCAMKDKLRRILEAQQLHNCGLLGRLDAIVCPRPNAENFDALIARAALEIILIWFEGLLSCICSALLPPCPAPADDNCIPLATVTVRRRDCHVLRVCNWTVHRKFATTAPALSYWFSILPFGQLLRTLIENLCCHLLDRFRRPTDDAIGQPTTGPIGSTQPPFSGGATNAAGGAASSSSGATGSTQPGSAAGAATARPFFDTEPFATRRSREISTVIANALLGRATTLDPETVFAGLAATGRKNGKSPLEEIERANLPQYLIAGELLAPFLRGILPEDTTDLATALFAAAPSAAERAETRAADVDTLRRELADLRAALAKQQETIDRLQRNR